MFAQKLQDLVWQIKQGLTPVFHDILMYELIICEKRSIHKAEFSLLIYKIKFNLSKENIKCLSHCHESDENILRNAKFYTVFQKKWRQIQITITTAYLIRIKYPLSSCNYHLSDVNVANFNKIHRTVSEQQLF